MKYYLTNGGNVLVSASNKNYFAKPSGEFIREVTENEATYLRGVCPQIEFKYDTNRFESEIPEWEFMFEKVIYDDFSSWEEGSDCNGGKYSYSTWARFYKWGVHVKMLQYHTCSSDFDYDALAGGHSTNVKSVLFYNTVDKFSLLTEDDEEVVMLEEYAENVDARTAKSLTYSILAKEIEDCKTSLLLSDEEVKVLFPDHLSTRRGGNRV